MPPKASADDERLHLRDSARGSRPHLPSIVPVAPRGRRLQTLRDGQLKIRPAGVVLADGHLSKHLTPKAARP